VRKLAREVLAALGARDGVAMFVRMWPRLRADLAALEERLPHGQEYGSVGG
jgi:hypothetical protein